jgi:hypothetical protein
MTSKNLEKHRKKFQNLISGETSETKPKRKSVIQITDSFDTSDNDTSTNLLSTSNDNSNSGTTNEVNSKIYVKRWVPNENIEGN